MKRKGNTASGSGLSQAFPPPSEKGLPGAAPRPAPNAERASSGARDQVAALPARLSHASVQEKRGRRGKVS
jgi:hypothetical protein